MAYEDGGFVTFFMDSVFNKSETKRLGHPVFEDVLMFKKVIPNQTTVVPRPATEEDKVKYEKSYQAFVTGHEPPESGTPLEKWHEITAGEIEMCRASQIKTVEQLVECSDGNIQKMGPGATNLKQRASKYLERINEGEVLRQENTELRERIAQLEASFEELSENAKPQKKTNGKRARYSM